MIYQITAEQRQQLLDGFISGDTLKYVPALTMLQSLAPVGAEPVAWAMREADGNVYDCICNEEHAKHEGAYTLPLYTHPAPEAKQEPVAVVDGGVVDSFHVTALVARIPLGSKLYTAAQPNDEALLRQAADALMGADNIDVDMAKAIDALLARLGEV